MSKDPLGGLAQSLQDENAAVEERFERAGQVLGRQGSSPRKKASVIRDTFSFPDFDYVLLSELQQRCLQGGQPCFQERARSCWPESLDSDEACRSTQGSSSRREAQARTGARERLNSMNSNYDIININDS